MVRTFLAIPLDENSVATASRLQRELAGLLPNVRWASSETMHLTVKFFGDLPKDAIQQITEILHLAAPRLTAFDTSLSGFGAFPSTRRATVLWLGVDNLPAFRELHSELEARFSAAGFSRDERSFTPHLTLGRCKKPLSLPDGLLAKYRHISCEKMKAEKLILFESRLQPQGAVHLPLCMVELPPERKM